jgi:penicillin-binding protein 2
MILRRKHSYKKKLRQSAAVYADDILLDIHNAPSFDTAQLEGRVVDPISKRTLRSIASIITAIFLLFLGRLCYLQIFNHTVYAERSEQNSLEHIPVFADRGVIYDRNGVELAWNTSDPQTKQTLRAYTSIPGFATLLGYVSYPAKDASGNFYQTSIVGRDGVERDFNEALSGVNGTKLVETNVSGDVTSESMLDAPKGGDNLYLSIDANLQQVMNKAITDLMASADFRGGTGLIMDIHTGELLTLNSAP